MTFVKFMLRILNMHAMDSRRAVQNVLALDLNLLKALDALARSRSLTEAGQRIGLSQPAMSHALSRLRSAFADDLFLRGPKGLVATPRGLSISANAVEVISLMQRSLQSAARFEPSRTNRRFRVGMNDYVSTTLLPLLLGRLRCEAPSIGLDVFHLPRATMHDQAGLPIMLDDSVIELAVGQIGTLPRHCQVERLREDPQICVLAAGHPAAAEVLDLPRFASLNHVKISSFPDRKSWIDEALEQQGMRRHIAVSVPHFTAAVALVSDSDLITTLPLSAVLSFRQNTHLSIRPCPLVARPHTMDMAWLRVVDQDPGLCWLMQNLREVAGSLGTTPLTPLPA